MLDSVTLDDVNLLLDSAYERQKEISLQLRFYLWASKEAIEEQQAKSEAADGGPGEAGIERLAGDLDPEFARKYRRKKRIQEILRSAHE